MAQSAVRQTSSSSASARTPARDLLSVITRHNDLTLAALLLAVLSLFVLPMPPLALDSLLAVNIAASVSLLMLALYIPSPLGLSTFPSLLLFTTLFRLALNIASTKQILLHANAGHIIDTFGHLVVGGNVVVGLVVFLIIALVQFIVVAKGSERVAEVGARFSLDGMPGKQMSIDADLRAGIIDKVDAKRRRGVLEQESQLHGAMDGAMKFVKGDAIAGLVIALINIVGGIAIGMGQHGMTLSEAAARYTVLTVGDGMVSQIPSLFVSIAAGILITRVATADDATTHLGGQIGRQVLSQPVALLMAGGVLLCFVLVPGFPKFQFIALGGLLLGLGLLSRAQKTRSKDFDATPMPSMRREGAIEAPPLIAEEVSPVVSPLTLRLHPGLRERLAPRRLDNAIELQREALARDAGIPFPGLQVRYDATLAPGHFVIDVQEVPARQGDLTAALAPTTSDAVPAETQIAASVIEAVRSRAEAFVGIQEVHALLARAEPHLPDLTAEVQRAVPLQRITEVLRRLAQEGVSLRYTREIFESLINWAPREKDVVMLTEYVRVDLGRFVAHRYLSAEGRLRAAMLDPATETLLRESIQQGPGGSFLALAPDVSRALLASAEDVVSRAAMTPPILLTSMDVRRYVRRFLGTRLPQLVVLSYQELPPEAQIDATGRIGVRLPERKAA